MTPPKGSAKITGSNGAEAVVTVESKWAKWALRVSVIIIIGLGGLGWDNIKGQVTKEFKDQDDRITEVKADLTKSIDAATKAVGTAKSELQEEINDVENEVVALEGMVNTTALQIVDHAEQGAHDLAEFRLDDHDGRISTLEAEFVEMRVTLQKVLDGVEHIKEKVDK